MTQVDILGVRVNGLTQEAALMRMAALVNEGGFHHVVTVNPEFIMRAQWDDAFRAVLNYADLALPDGVGILWAARWLYGPGHVPERITGVDTVERMAALAADQGWRLFLLGAAEGVAARAAQMLCQRYPHLRVVGVYAGSPADTEANTIIAKVNDANTDILFVAYGAPVQDLWIARHRERLRVRLAMGVGGAFDFISGVVCRAPVWVQRLGLEWFYRLIHQPWRWRRMLVLPKFALRVILLKWQRPDLFSNTEQPNAR
jgi:N-acetylglucosaminyldiphosphoundecaprenol N-acetyl-beta-D-mannosaminyltransferase